MIFSKVIRLVVAGFVLTFGTAGYAQVPPELNAAIAAGDTTAIGSIISANESNPAVLADIANALLAAAESIKTANPTLAALLAAGAVTTGALSDGAQQRALNIVGSNPTALALLTNPNSLNNKFGNSNNANRPIGGGENGRTAENSGQNTGSRN